MTLAVLFDSVGFGEWFVLLAVVLIVVGPRKLPSAARTFGQYYARFRRAAENFKRQLLDMDTEFTRAAQEVERTAGEPFTVVEPTSGGNPPPGDNPPTGDNPPPNDNPPPGDAPSAEAGPAGAEPQGERAAGEAS